MFNFFNDSNNKVENDFMMFETIMRRQNLFFLNQ